MATKTFSKSELNNAVKNFEKIREIWDDVTIERQATADWTVLSIKDGFGTEAYSAVILKVAKLVEAYSTLGFDIFFVCRGQLHEGMTTQALVVIEVGLRTK